MDQPETILEKGYGSALALPIWVDFMQHLPDKTYPAAPRIADGTDKNSALFDVGFAGNRWMRAGACGIRRGVALDTSARTDLRCASGTAGIHCHGARCESRTGPPGAAGGRHDGGHAAATGSRGPHRHRNNCCATNDECAHHFAFQPDNRRSINNTCCSPLDATGARCDEPGIPWIDTAWCDGGSGCRFVPAGEWTRRFFTCTDTKHSTHDHRGTTTANARAGRRGTNENGSGKTSNPGQRKRGSRCRESKCRGTPCRTGAGASARRTADIVALALQQR